MLNACYIPRHRNTIPSLNIWKLKPRERGKLPMSEQAGEKRPREWGSVQSTGHVTLWHSLPQGMDPAHSSEHREHCTWHLRAPTHSSPERPSQSSHPQKGGILKRSWAGLTQELGPQWWTCWWEKPKRFSLAHVRTGCEAVPSFGLSIWIGLLEILALVS